MATFSEKALIRSFTDLKLFHRIIPDNHTFHAALRKFPKNAKRLMQVALRSSDELHRLIKDIFFFVHFPQYSSDVIQILLSNPAEFKYFIHTGLDLVIAAKACPDHAEALIQIVLNDSTLLKNLFGRYADLIRVAQMFPKHAETLCLKVLNDLAMFQHIIACCDFFVTIAEICPLYAEIMIHTVLNNPKEFQRLIKSGKDFIKLVKHFTQHEKALFQKVHNSPDELARLSENGDHFQIAGAFPHQAEALIQVVLNSPDKFRYFMGSGGRELILAQKQIPQHVETLIQALLNVTSVQRIFDYGYDLVDFAIHFPHHADAMFKIVLSDPTLLGLFLSDNTSYSLLHVARYFPTHAESMIQMVINDPAKFMRVFTSTSNLIHAAHYFPQHADAIVQILLNNSDYFTYVVRDFRDLNQLLKQFPRQKKIFDQPSITRVLDILLSRKEVIKNALLFSEANRASMGFSFFQRVPVNLQEEIAALTSNPKTHDFQEALAITAGIIHTDIK